MSFRFWKQTQKRIEQMNPFPMQVAACPETPPRDPLECYRLADEKKLLYVDRQAGEANAYGLQFACTLHKTTIYMGLAYQASFWLGWMKNNP